MPLQKSIHFVDGKMTSANLKIIGKDKRPLYLLECYLNAFDKKDNNFDYTGAFECRLTSLFDDYYAHRTLLTDQNPQLRDWHSRGVFRIEELMCKSIEGICIEYPGYGKVRHFKLRGMDIALEIKNFKMEPNGGRIKDLEFEVRVNSDPNAITEIAEPIKYDDPLYRQIKWPEISPFKKIVHFAGRQSTKLEIVGRRGTPLYLLQCYLNPSDDDNDSDHFSYSGAFECRLTSRYDNRQSTLLTENPYPTRDWESRGRFLIEEITGKCADYPDYGRVRNFKLRGMNLTLEIKDFKIKPASSAENAPWYVERIKELTLYVTVTPDPKALSEIAEPTKYVEPPRAHPGDPNDKSLNCEKVLNEWGDR